MPPKLSPVIHLEPAVVVSFWIDRPCRKTAIWYKILLFLQCFFRRCCVHLYRSSGVFRTMGLNFINGVLLIKAVKNITEGEIWTFRLFIRSTFAGENPLRTGQRHCYRYYFFNTYKGENFKNEILNIII